MNEQLKKAVEEYKKITPDICEHLDTLTMLAKGCLHITEMGFRHGASTSALLLGQPVKLISYDLMIPAPAKEFIDSIKGDISVDLIQANTLHIDIHTTDLLFIDTLHTYSQLKKELELHGNKSTKYLVFHDTVTFGHKGEDGSEKGLLDAIEEFLDANPHWQTHLHFTNNNGLTVLKRSIQPLKD